MTRRVYLYFFITAIMGAILGGAGVYYYLWYNGRLQHTEKPADAVQHLKKVLNLSDDQAKQVQRIFDETAQEMRDVTKQVAPQYQAIHKERLDRIRQVLTPEQAKKFDEHLKKIDERRNRRGPPPPH